MDPVFNKVDQLKNKYIKRKTIKDKIRDNIINKVLGWMTKDIKTLILKWLKLQKVKLLKNS